MKSQLLFVVAFTFIIHLISTLSYSVRLVGVRTGRIAISFALFNILVLISRTANGFQAPLLAKSVEDDLKAGVTGNVAGFRLIIFACTAATIVGAFLIPSFQRVLSKAVRNFSVNKSIPSLIFHGFSKNGLVQFRENLAMPHPGNIELLKIGPDFPWRIFIMNVIATSFITIGVLSAVYAAYFTPEYRTTASNMSAIINGVSTVLMFIFIDPHLSAMTDDVMLGKCAQETFRKHVIYMTVARLAGTLIAQLVFLPAASIIAWTAQAI